MEGWRVEVLEGWGLEGWWLEGSSVVEGWRVGGLRVGEKYSHGPMIFSNTFERLMVQKYSDDSSFNTFIRELVCCTPSALTYQVPPTSTRHNSPGSTFTPYPVLYLPDSNLPLPTSFFSPPKDPAPWILIRDSENWILSSWPGSYTYSPLTPVPRSVTLCLGS